MATKYASAAGNWSTMVWWTTSGGTTTTAAPTTGDTADLNGKAVTIDGNITLDAIVGAGTLTITGNRTITAAVGGAADTFTCNIGTSNQTVSFVGTVTGGASGTRITAGGNNTVNVSINGNVVGSASAASVTTISVNSGAHLTVTGDVTGGTGNSGSRAISCGGGGTTASGFITIFGNVTGMLSQGVLMQPGTLVITGNVNGSATSGQNGVYINTQSGSGITSSTTINGTMTGGITANAAAVRVDTGGTLVLSGAIVGGGASGAHGLLVTGALASITVNANVQGGANCNGISLTAGSTINLAGTLTDSASGSAVSNQGGTVSYTPASTDTATIGGKTMYPTAGAPKLWTAAGRVQ